MDRRGFFGAATAAGFAAIGFCSSALAQRPADPLPSWNDGAAKRAIIDFVARVTASGGANFVAADQRIAVFDNDGTLWCERPNYLQAMFALDRIRAMAPQHPEWRTTQPFKAVLEKGIKALLGTDEKSIAKIVAATDADTTEDDFASAVRDWMATARHPRFNRRYDSLVYQPMLELLSYLRANGFKIFIVSSGGVDFMRPWVEKVYGVPSEQLVGSSFAANLPQSGDGKPVLVKDATIKFIDDGPGKPVGIDRFIGRRPIFAFGNSDGDRQMLESTMAGAGPHFAGLIHHTDGLREYAYDRHSKVGKLDKTLDEAVAKKWTIVDMRNDWKTIFPPEQ